MQRQLENTPFWIPNYNYSRAAELLNAASATNETALLPTTVKSNPDFQTCDHLKKVLERRLTYNVLAKCLDELASLDFDALAFSGMSGALVAPVLSHLMGKELIMVRIPGTPNCHSTLPVEGYSGSKRYVIVDDLVGGGRTCSRIIRGVKLFAPQAELIGFMLYNSFFHPVNSPTVQHVMRVIKLEDQKETE
jgi:orotate phosphoribosyltransferase-like protein